MHTAKQKISDMASKAKEKIAICQAKTEEKTEKAMARTKEEKEIAHERRKAKEAEAKMELHIAKAAHTEEKLRAKQSRGQHLLRDPHLPPPGIGYQHPTGVTPAATTTGGSAAVPAYPPVMGQHPHGHKFI